MRKEPAVRATARDGLVAIALVCLVLGLAGCGASRQLSGTVDGIVLFEGGPGNPPASPALPGGFGSGSQGRPYRWVTVQAKAISGPKAGEIVASVKPDAKALFSVSLPPGRYQLVAVVPKNGPWPYCVTRVTARAGQHARAIVIVTGP